MTEREEHELIADALAAIRFYRRCHGSGGPSAERLREITQTLRDAGTNGNSRLLAAAAEAVGQGYTSSPPPGG